MEGKKRTIMFSFGICFKIINVIVKTAIKLWMSVSERKGLC